MIVGSVVVAILVLLAWSGLGILGLYLIITSLKGDGDVPSDRERGGEEEDS